MVDESLEAEGWSTFLRIRVLMDITKPLRRVVSVKGADGNHMGRLSYERIPLFCKVCGYLGHHYLDCDHPEATTIIDSGNFPYGAWLCASPFKRKREAIGSEAFKQLGKRLGVKDSGGAVKTTNRALFLDAGAAKQTNWRTLAVVATGKEVGDQDPKISGLLAKKKELNADFVGDNIAGFLELERSRFGEKLKVTEEENNNGRNDLRDVRDKSQDSVEIQSCRALEAVKGGGGPLGSKGFLFREEIHSGCSVGLDKIEGDPSTKVIVKGPEPATGFEFQATKQKSESAVLSTSRASQSRPNWAEHGGEGC
ncbi:Zinc knuckle CX2CX4HX4C [Corchorus olitorius]|uniref:Zinc knuckle CX2CX4HX4C n=1 Tax=Corchorus olitorius TaxID=93759 RepID=A0A1R3IRP9_9ROSI|nr:Zinc knuckle CX2CX4HX4C [Corchorus olitorius]